MEIIENGGHFFGVTLACIDEQILMQILTRLLNIFL
jgi:hypothetical protein